MQSKKILAVVAAIFMAQASSASTNITETVEKYVEEAENLWTEVEEKVEDAVSYAESSINSTASNLLSGWEKKIERVAAKVNASVTLVESCVKEAASLPTVATGIVDDSVSCVVTTFTDALKVINATVIKIEEDAESVAARLRACMEEAATPRQKGLCIEKEAVSLAQIGKLVNQVIGDALALGRTVQGWGSVLYTCSVDSLMDAENKAATILNNVIACFESAV